MMVVTTEYAQKIIINIHHHLTVYVRFHLSWYLTGVFEVFLTKKLVCTYVAA